MKEKLKTKPDIFEMLQPDFSPGCRRLTPGPGFLEALVEENVEFTNSRIVRATKDVSTPFSKQDDPTGANNDSLSSPQMGKKGKSMLSSVQLVSTPLSSHASQSQVRMG